MRAGIRAVDAGLLVQRSLPAGDARPHRVIAAGKAAGAMAIAAQETLGPLTVSGVVIAPSLVEVPGPFSAIVGQHPQPGEGSERGGREALALCRGALAHERILVLLSGGASSLMAVPAAGITLADKRHATAMLLRGGADIAALNTVRKHLSSIKGGRLAASSKAPCVALVGLGCRWRRRERDCLGADRR